MDRRSFTNHIMDDAPNGWDSGGIGLMSNTNVVDEIEESIEESKSAVEKLSVIADVLYHTGMEEEAEDIDRIIKDYEYVIDLLEDICDAAEEEYNSR